MRKYVISIVIITLLLTGCHKHLNGFATHIDPGESSPNLLTEDNINEKALSTLISRDVFLPNKFPFNVSKKYGFLLSWGNLHTLEVTFYDMKNMASVSERISTEELSPTNGTIVNLTNQVSAVIYNSNIIYFHKGDLYYSLIVHKGDLSLDEKDELIKMANNICNRD